MVNKYVLLLLLIFSSSIIFGQHGNCDCSSLTPEKLTSKYYEFKKYGLEIQHSNSAKADVIDVIINNILKVEGIRQACMEACYDITYIKGEVGSYNKFVRFYGNIDKNLYMQNIYYIQTLINIRELTLKAYKFN